MDVIVLIPMSIVAIIVMLWSAYFDLKRFKAQKKILYLMPIVFGCLFLGAILKIHLKNEFLLNRPTLLYLVHSESFGGYSIDLKNDGDYVLSSHSLVGNYYTYGRYQMKGNSIELDSNKLNLSLKTNLLKIGPEIIENPIDSIPRKRAYQVNDFGEILKDADNFRVVTDNRIMKSDEL
jgi:hypothetical protein